MGPLALTVMAQGFVELLLKQYLQNIDSCQAMLVRIMSAGK